MPTYDEKAMWEQDEARDRRAESERRYYEEHGGPEDDNELSTRRAESSEVTPPQTSTQPTASFERKQSLLDRFLCWLRNNH